MASRKELLSVTYHDDDDTGMYEIGEIDFGINGTLSGYLKRYGRPGVQDIQLALAHLIWAVEDEWHRLPKENTATSNASSDVGAAQTH